MIFNRDNQSIKLTIFILDIFFTIISFASALLIRITVFRNLFFEFNLEIYSIIFIITILMWIIMLRVHNPIPTLPNYSFKDVVFDLIKRIALGVIIIFSISFLMRGIIISRLFILLFGILNILFLFAERRLFFIYKRRKFRKGKDLTRVLIVGNEQNPKDLVGVMSSHTDWGIKLVDTVDAEKLKDLSYIENWKTMHIDIVIFIINKNSLEIFNNSIVKLMQSGITTMLYLDSFIDSGDAFIDFQSFLNLDFLTFSSSKERELSLYIKYSMDRIMACILLILLSPIMLFTAFLLWIFEGKPILFSQKRVGYNGRLFNMLKFRTMCRDAELKKEKLKKNNCMSGPVFKMKNDPRVNRFGRFLRRWSIDEFPQLINIIKGEMSFVGPRPPLPDEVKEYKLWQRRRLSLRPGLTCTWQISGRNNIDFIRWMQMDMEYIDHWSLLYDIVIVIKTIPAIISNRGNI